MPLFVIFWDRHRARFPKEKSKAPKNWCNTLLWICPKNASIRVELQLEIINQKKDLKIFITPYVRPFSFLLEGFLYSCLVFQALFSSLMPMVLLQFYKKRGRVRIIRTVLERVNLIWMDKGSMELTMEVKFIQIIFRISFNRIQAAGIHTRIKQIQIEILFQVHSSPFPKIIMLSE